MTPLDEGAVAAEQAATARSRRRSRLAHVSDRYGTLVAFAAMLLLFSLLRPSTFATWSDFSSILDQAAPIVVLSVGLTLVMSTGQFDLSFPGVLNLASAGAVLMMVDVHQGWILAVLVSLAIGVCAGAIAGLIVASGRATSFIITLALSTIWSGVAIGVSASRTITDLPTSYTNITFDTVVGIPNSVVIAVAVSLMVFVLMRWSVLGRYIQVLGSNTGAARLSGIRIHVTLVSAFVLFGLCNGITAVLLTSSAGLYTPTIGSGLLITPFVAVFFGTSVLGARRFNVFGSVVGALFITALQTGMVVLNIAPWVSDVILGVALILALVVIAKRSR